MPAARYASLTNPIALFAYGAAEKTQETSRKCFGTATVRGQRHHTCVCELLGFPTQSYLTRGRQGHDGGTKHSAGGQKPEGNQPSRHSRHHVQARGKNFGPAGRVSRRWRRRCVVFLGPWCTSHVELVQGAQEHRPGRISTPSLVLCGHLFRCFSSCSLRKFRSLITFRRSYLNFNFDYWLGISRDAVRRKQRCLHWKTELGRQRQSWRLPSNQTLHPHQSAKFECILMDASI